MARVLLLGLVAACTPEDHKPGPQGGNEGPTGDPSIELVSPEDGAGSYGGAFTLAWDVKNFTLDAADLGGDAADGRGHVHVYVDDQLVEETAEDGYAVEGLADGAHTFVVRLADNDHEELAATDSASVEVRNPSVRILAPSDGAMLSASSTPLSIGIDDFDLSAELGSADVFGSGHFRVLVDGQPRDFGADPLVAAATGLTEGAHTIGVELVTNDGKPLDPPVLDEISLTVPVGARGVYWNRDGYGDSFDSATLPLGLSVTAFTLYPRELGRPPADGEGHFHLFMDGVWLDATADTSRILQNVAPGPHVFEARLTSNDSVELPIVDRLWVNIADDRPDAVVTYPGSGWAMGPSFDLTFDTENFTMDAASMDGANAPHTGHAQVLLDGLLHTETANALVPVSGLLPGSHVLRVELVNNDRTPLVPAVYQEFPFTVE